VSGRVRAPSPARVARRAERREALLDAAVEVIRRDGPGASMEAMAVQAGVTKPILYRHFGDRDGLVEALGERFFTELSDRLGGALGVRREPRALLHDGIDAYVSFIEAEPAMYRFLMQQGGQRGGEPITALAHQMGRRIAAVLHDQLAAAGLDTGASEPWAYGIVGMVHLAGDWWVDRQTMARERLVGYLTDLLWSGLAGGAAALGRAAGPSRAPSAD
jgi:AcrR family transcriptional regulator